MKEISAKLIGRLAEEDADKSLRRHKIKKATKGTVAAMNTKDKADKNVDRLWNNEHN